MRSILEESMLETRIMPLENRPRIPRIPLSKRNRAVVRALNPMLVTYLEESRDFCETDSILFGAAQFHRKCASIPIDGRISNKWQCSGCKAKNVCASGVNTFATPSSCSSGGTDTVFSDAQLGSDDRGRCESNVDLANELKLIREQFTTIAREMVSFRHEITDINSNVEISNRVSDVKKRIACLEQQATDLPSQPRGSKVEDSIAELKCRLNERDQELLLNDLEISGVIEQKGENPLHLVTMLAAKIGIELDERDVVSARRLMFAF
ncbi:unnamed protein product [Parnassius apollo]|uniref:(apollo) hypothetical protein n=1 Tax=Parnassius apollo TaxID=110799 RepID=A0A8S3W458_PARAO|nr:unnamed protein product [Parnassius apollo]